MWKSFSSKPCLIARILFSGIWYNMFLNQNGYSKFCRLRRNKRKTELFQKFVDDVSLMFPSTNSSYPVVLPMLSDGLLFTKPSLHQLGVGQNVLLSIWVGWTSMYQLFWGSLCTRLLTLHQFSVWQVQANPFIFGFGGDLWQHGATGQ